VYRLAYNGDVVAFKMDRLEKRIPLLFRGKSLKQFVPFCNAGLLDSRGNEIRLHPAMEFAVSCSSGKTVFGTG